jgi:hypothetical protein
VSPDERRTTALRGPGAGGFTPPTSVAASNPCLNCATNVQLEYCPECGQREIDPDPTLREFAHELAEEFLHWDGKLVTTFRALLLKPGLLTQEYLGGRRVRYISPLRLYLSCSLLFFFASALVVQSPHAEIAGRGARTQVGAISIGATDNAAIIASLDTLAIHGRWVGRVWGKHFGTAMRTTGQLASDVASAIPKTMFVLVPLFATLVMMVFRRSRRRFPQHLAFALHVHAFLFLALTLMLLRHATSATWVQVPIVVLCLGAVTVYLVRAVSAVYEVSTGAAIARSAIVSTAYFVCFLVAMVLTFGLIVLLQF